MIRALLKLAVALLVSLQVIVASAGETFVRLATTTSTENSGLLESLLPVFEHDTRLKVHVIAVGTGKALRLLRQGDVDVVLVHARAAEDQLLADGYGIDRRDVMYNDFVLIGPEDDSGGIRGNTDASAALTRIAANGVLFISRGDDSGTHKKERQLWQQAGVEPAGAWYREVGQGMGKVLQIADELQACTLTDRGTWLAYREKVDLEILVEGDKRLHNPYGIIAANPDKYPDINYMGAMQLINWITSPKAQAMIADFSNGGQPLFVPSAGK